MKITVKIDGRAFVVETGDLQSRPVIAMVDGERFEVWPEGQPALDVASAPAPPLGATDSAGKLGGNGNGDTQKVSAPIPGVIISIAVQAGDAVQSGQELCVLEAMKMKNVIRATRDGKIAAVKVAVGQHVQHGNVLVTYAE
jgi:biotin carboxyl carrier protein